MIKVQNIHQVTNQQRNSSLLARAFLANSSIYFIGIMYENPGDRGPLPPSADAQRVYH